MKLNDADIEDLTGKSFRIIINNGKEGILQSNLWKQLDLTSRDGSRLAIRLEKRSLIKREKILENGRWTYKLFPVKLPVGTQSIEQAPCLTCPVEHMCSVDAYYSPTNCNLIENWILVSFNSGAQEHELGQDHAEEVIVPGEINAPARHGARDPELLVSESNTAIAKHQSKGLLKNKKR